MPDYVTVREARVQIWQPEFRTKGIVVVTNLLDPVRYPKEALADLYRRRWNNELDQFMAIVEVCGFNDWLIEELRRQACREIVLIHPEKPSKTKTDRRDAQKQADLLWLNRGRLGAGQVVRGLRRVYPSRTGRVACCWGLRGARPVRAAAFCGLMRRTDRFSREKRWPSGAPTRYDRRRSRGCTPPVSSHG